MPLFGEFAAKNTKQPAAIGTHGGKARRRPPDAPQEAKGTVTLGLRLTPGERAWIAEYAWRNRTTVGKLVRAYFRTLREEEETGRSRQKAITR